MGKLIYAALTSLDGYISDKNGNFDWAEPQEDVHTFINKLELANGTLILGKDMYSILTFWEDLSDVETQPKYIQEYQAAWKKEKKFVFSTTLKEVTTNNTILKRELNEIEIKEIKKQEEQNIGIGGANIASQVLSFGLIDEVYQFIIPIMIGSGKKWLTSSEPISFQRIESRDFLNGVVMLHYKVVNYKEERTEKNLNLKIESVM
jgi:dihydrofolate reductase